MSQKTITLEEINKRYYNLGRKLYNLEVAYEITTDKENKQEIEKYIEETMKELKKTAALKSALKFQEKEGEENAKYKGK